jgi:hypothetical protein
MTQNVADADFRDTGSYLFYDILTLCQVSNNTIINAVAVFNTDIFISSQAMTRMYILNIFILLNEFLFSIIDYLNFIFLIDLDTIHH